MSKFSKLLGGALSILGLGTPKVPALPVPKIPAAPAPTRRVDTGASVIIGSPTTDQRVSGGGNTSIGRKVDILGGLGLGGLRI